MSKVTLQDITSGYNSTTKINANNDTIETAFDNTLSRDGSSPNSMNATLDMNSKRILNLGSPESSSDAARWADVTSALSISTALPSQTGNADKAVFTDGSNLSFRKTPYTARTSAEVTASVTPTDYSYDPGDIRRYGAVGDGNTNDTTAIQNAVNVAQIAGGTVVFPTGKWGIGTQITVSSLYPVNLIGQMTANPSPTANASYIYPTGNISGSMFKYVSPTGTISDGGGGTISGLSFLDKSNLGAGTAIARRNYTMTAAIDLDSFAAGIVENCSFHYLKGSAILFGYVIQTRFSALHARFCGDTSKATFLARSTGSYQLQGSSFIGIISEVNFTAPHIQLASNTQDTKWVGCTFETTETADETSAYVSVSGLRNTFDNCSFNRRPSTGYAVDFTSGAGRCLVSNSHFDLQAGLAVVFNGDRNSIVNSTIVAATSSTAPLSFVGVRNVVRGTYFYSCPGFTVNSSNNVIDGCYFDLILGAGYQVDVTANGTNSVISNCLFLAPNAAGLNGIRFSTSGIISNNMMPGGTAAATGITLASSNIICAENYLSNWTTALSPNSGCTIKNNISYVNEASGATSVADGGTVTHGLATTPTRVYCTGSVASEFISVTALGATTFTVAIKKDTGAAGTTQTIYWKAEV